MSDGDSKDRAIEKLLAHAESLSWPKDDDSKPVDCDEAALLSLFEAYRRLKDMGWRDITYCPKDGTVFESISAGSTGIHRCYYTGEWPKGCWWVMEAGDIWPARPILWRPLPDKNDDP